MTDPSTLLLSEDQIQALIPATLPRRADERYPGGAVHGKLERDFGEEEADCLKALYEDLGDLMAMTKAPDDEKVLSAALKEFANRTVLIRAVSDLEKYEQAARATYDTRLGNLFREISDGPVASLCAILFLIRSAGVEADYFQTLYYLARDQRKIMRAILVDLDPVARAKDEAVNVHSIDLLLEKWQNAVYRSMDADLEVAFETSVEGMVAERCIEFAEVDRIFYHLVNNARSHGSGNRLAIQAIDSKDGLDLVWVFSNPVTENQAARLDNLEEGLESVFDYGIGEGSGVGLGSLAESVAHAYGIDTPGQAVSNGYAGTKLDGDIFRIWFHWPKA